MQQLQLAQLLQNLRLTCRLEVATVTGVWMGEEVCRVILVGLVDGFF